MFAHCNYNVAQRYTLLSIYDKMYKNATISNYEVGRRSPHLTDLRKLAEFYGVGLDYFGVNTTDESFELLSRAKSVFLNDNIPKEEKERLYKSIMKIYLQMD